MMNKYFPDEEIAEDDLYFICYMIECVARNLHQRNRYVANTIGKEEFRNKYVLLKTEGNDLISTDGKIVKLKYINDDTNVTQIY